MAVVLIVVVVAAVALCAVLLWRRSQRNGSSASSTQAATPIHAEFGPGPGPGPAAGDAPSEPPRESYYAHAPPNRAKGRPMGWYSVNGSHGDERYWDGQKWTMRRQMVAGEWSSIPVGGD